MSPPSRQFILRGLIDAASLRRTHFWGACLTLFLAPRTARAEPATSAAQTLSEADLGPVSNVANILSSQAPCVLGGTDPTAASAFARAASLLDVAARHYPPRANPRLDLAAHARKRLILVDQAVTLYERAYQCAPSYSHRHPLESAIDLLDAAKELAVTTDRLPADAPELEKLTARRSDLAIRLPVPPPPPPCPITPPCPPAPEPAPEPIRFILRPELGIGTGTVTNNNDNPDPAHFNGIYFQLVAATRFPLGARKVHGFSMGGAFGVQQVAPRPQFEDGPTSRSALQGGLHLEFALHAHPRWFSFHPMVDIGVQAYVGGIKLGRGQVSPALGLCLDRELVCFSARAALPFTAPGKERATIFMGQFGLAVDLMRIVERRRGR